MSDITITEKSLASVFPTGNITWDGMEAGEQREFSDGLALQKDRDRESGKAIITDFFPYVTTLQKEWEEVFRLPIGTNLTYDQRMDRLIAAWTKKSPANYTEMNEIYALSGFDLIARPLEPGEDPRLIADSDQEVKTYDTVTGLNAVTGLNTLTGAFTLTPGTSETTIYADGRPGTTSKNYITKTGSSRCGQLSTSSLCGNFEGSKESAPDVTIPDDVWTWALIYIIEGKDGEFAQVPIELKDGFDFLTYKIKPNVMWAISRVEYV